MTIHVRFRDLESSESLRAHIIRWLGVHLGRVGNALSTAVVRVSDVNGPKGGVDKRCQVMLRRPGQPAVMVEEVRADIYAAVDVAVERAASALKRGLGRTRAARRDRRVLGTA